MDRWHKVDASGNVNSFDPDGEWVPGKYPSTRVQDPRIMELNRVSGITTVLISG